MLNKKKLQSFFAFHAEALGQSLNLMAAKPLANLMIILVIATALALPAFFWVFTDNLKEVTVGWQHGGHISLYLKPMSETAQKNLLETLKRTPDVGQANLKSSASGLTELMEQEGMHDIMRYLPENPLPDVIDILPALSVNTPNQLSALAKQLKGLPNVEQVKWDREWITRLHVILHFAEQIAHVLMIALALAVILIIGTTLRLSIHTRHEEIQVLKLIGASDKYILRPYLYLGIWYGMAGAFLAVLMVNIFVMAAGSMVNQLAAVYQMHYPLTGLLLRQMFPLIVFSIALGNLAARLSVRRQLQSIEPYI